jgi:hypothetical protein
MGKRIKYDTCEFCGREDETVRENDDFESHDPEFRGIIAESICDSCLAIRAANPGNPNYQ